MPLIEEENYRGKFGRVLAELWIDDTNVNKWLCYYRYDAEII